MRGNNGTGQTDVTHATWNQWRAWLMGLDLERPALPIETNGGDVPPELPKDERRFRPSSHLLSVRSRRIASRNSRA